VNGKVKCFFFLTCKFSGLLCHVKLDELSIISKTRIFHLQGESEEMY